MTANQVRIGITCKSRIHLVTCLFCCGAKYDDQLLVIPDIVLSTKEGYEVWTAEVGVKNAVSDECFQRFWSDRFLDRRKQTSVFSKLRQL